MKYGLLKTAAFALVMLTGFSCKTKIDKYDNWPEWPTPSNPVIENVEVTPVDDPSSNIVAAGRKVKASASVSDEFNELTSASVVFKVGEDEIGRSVMELSGNSAEVDFEAEVPFIANLDNGARVSVSLVANNNYRGETAYTLPEEESLTVNRPESPAMLFLVDADGEVFEMAKSESEDYLYETSDDVSAVAFPFKIAEKLVNGDEIDYAGMVWGTDAGKVSIVKSDDADGITITIPPGEAIKSYTLDIYSFMAAALFEPVLIEKSAMTASSYAGYIELEAELKNANEVVFEGFDGDVASIVNPGFFTPKSGNTVVFRGQTGSYKVLLEESSGFIYVEQRSARYPDAMWICGSGLGFGQEPYRARLQWNWSKPSDYVFMNKVGNDLFEAVVYAADGFGFKFFHQRNWANPANGNKEEQSYNFTKLPEGVMIDLRNEWNDPVGDCGPGENFVPGLYRLRIDMANKVITMTKL